MPLTDAAVRAAKPGEKVTRLYDGRGLYLEISPKGGKWWRFRYRIDQKEKRISLGVYPDVGLKEARKRRDEQRRLVAQGIDPSSHRKALRRQQAERAANSFDTIGREWLVKQSSKWSMGTAKAAATRLERNVFPWLGGRPISEIKPPEILAVLRRIEQRGCRETTHRIFGIIRQIFDYAIITSRVEWNAASGLKAALQTPNRNHFAAITDPKEIPAFLRAIDGYWGGPVVRSALRLLPLLLIRPGELCKAEWKCIDSETAQWRFTATKTNTPHIVPLSRQAIDILEDLRPLTGQGRFVFPSRNGPSEPMTTSALRSAMRAVGILNQEMTAHGCRAMGRTILDEQLGFPAHIIEQQLAHTIRDPNGRAYNRTKHLPERCEMMQRWADYLDSLRNGDIQRI